MRREVATIQPPTTERLKEAMTKAKTEAERRQFLEQLGLNADAPGLQPSEPVKSKEKVQTSVEIQQDAHTMPVSDIVFDPALLDEFPDLSGSNYKAASEHVFALYKSPHRDPERHALLHRRITEFIGQVKRARKTGGYVKDKIKAGAEQREMAEVLAEHNITTTQLIALLKEK